MSMRSFNAYMLRPSSLLLALGFFCSLPANSLSQNATEATLQSVLDEQQRTTTAIDTGFDQVIQEQINAQDWRVQVWRSLQDTISGIDAANWSIRNALGNDEQQLNSGPWLKQFLLGSQSDPWYTSNPQFRFLQDDRGSQSLPANSAQAQSLVNFLSLTLGQFTQPYTPGMSDFDHAFSSINSWMSNNGVGFQVAGYNIFSVWLAEALRRQIVNSTNLVTGDWTLLNGSTNPTQAVRLFSAEQPVQESSWSNSVTSLDEQIEEMRPEESGVPTGYDNDEDFASASALIGPSDGELSWSGSILIAKHSDISLIMNHVGVVYNGPTAEFDALGNSAIGDGVYLVSTTMETVWNWVRSLAVLAIVIYWYRRCRGLATAIYCGNRRAK